MINILQMPGMLHGGVGSVVMNIYRRIDKRQYQFDFCVVSDTEFRDEIESYGGKIFVIPKRKDVGTLSYIKIIKQIIIEQNYKIVHIHSVFTGVYSLLAAYLAHVPVRIYHAHNTKDGIISNLRFKILIEPLCRFVINILSTDRVSCGKDAGDFVFGAGKHSVIPNGIDIEKFKPIDDFLRNKKRQEYGYVESDIIIGNIASFIEVKNQDYFLKIALKDKNGSCKFLLIGDGPLLDKFKKKVKDLDLEFKFRLLGSRKDVNLLYNIMDVYCLPSLFEGLPVTAIEAQASGTPVVTSSNVTDEADMKVCPYVKMDNYEDIDSWINTIYKLRNESNRDERIVQERIRAKGYDLVTSVQMVTNLYEKAYHA